MTKRRSCVDWCVSWYRIRKKKAMYESGYVHGCEMLEFANGCGTKLRAVDGN